MQATPSDALPKKDFLVGEYESNRLVRYGFYVGPTAGNHVVESLTGSRFLVANSKLQMLSRTGDVPIEPRALFGMYLRRVRASTLTLRGLAAALGVSAPYIHDVEVGNRACLEEHRWATLLAAVPDLDKGELQRLALLGKRQFTISGGWPPELRAVVAACVLRASDDTPLTPEERAATQPILAALRWS